MTIGGDTGYQQCLYGSEKNPGTTEVYTWLDNSVLPEAILTLLTELAPWALAATVGSMVAIDQLCNQEPPQPQAFTADDFLGILTSGLVFTSGTGQAVIDKLQQNIVYYAWKQYCQCVPQPQVCDHCGPCDPGTTESLTGQQTEVIGNFCCSPYCWVGSAGQQFWLCDIDYAFGTVSLIPPLQTGVVKIQIGTAPTTGMGYSAPGNNFAVFNPTSGAGSTGTLTAVVDPNTGFVQPQLTYEGELPWSVTMHNVRVAEHPTAYVGCPDVPQPPATTFPPQPSGPTCDLNQLCQLLQDLLQRLQNMARTTTIVNNTTTSTSAVLNETSSQVTNIYNTGAPSSYKYGATYTLSGNGAQAVASGTLGLLVHFVTVPTWVPGAEGDPTGRYNVGWINLGNDDGWFHKVWLHYDGQLVFPEFYGITQVGYWLQDSGSVITVQELLPMNG